MYGNEDTFLEPVCYCWLLMLKCARPSVCDINRDLSQFSEFSWILSLCLGTPGKKTEEQLQSSDCSLFPSEEWHVGSQPRAELMCFIWEGRSGLASTFLSAEDW